MKSLKRVKVLMMALLVALLTVLLFACEEPIPPSPVNSDPSVAQVIKGTLYAHTLRGAYNDPNTFAQFQATGTTDGLGLEKISIIHYRADFEGSGEFIIYAGEGNTLYGTYDGFGERESFKFNEEWMLTITNGTGEYENWSGYFIEKIRFVEGTEEKPVYKIDLSGRLIWY